VVNEREELGPDLARWYRTMPLRLFVAPLGLAFYTGDNLPQKYRGPFFWRTWELEQAPSSARRAAGLCPKKLGGAAARPPACLHRNQADDRFAQALARLSQRLQFGKPASLATQMK
jgi:hypothetical protein